MTDAVSRGERLRALREKAGLSLREAARQADTHHAILGDLERGAGTRRLMTHAGGLRRVFGDEIVTLAAEDEEERAVALAYKLMAAQIEARLEVAARVFVMEGRPPGVVTWTGNPEEVATEPERIAKQRREVALHNRQKAAVLTPALIAALANVRLGNGDLKIAEAICAKWQDFLAPVPEATSVDG